MDWSEVQKFIANWIGEIIAVIAAAVSIWGATVSSLAAGRRKKNRNRIALVMDKGQRQLEEILRYKRDHPGERAETKDLQAVHAAWLHEVDGVLGLIDEVLRVRFNANIVTSELELATAERLARLDRIVDQL